jgi:lipopolysaccharide/colanic/teichoic acid biosynthesis glycosyltransferase
MPSGVSPGRRALDILVAGTVLILLAPLLVVLAVLVRVTSRGPIIFRQHRLTTGHREFTMYKFRTMLTDHQGGDLTSAGDARITGPGRVMRRTSLDELPQLVNVLLGDMTLVGPRPETPALAAQYPSEARWILEETAGLTGPAQISLRDDVTLTGSLTDPADVERWYVETLVPQRVAADQTFLADPTVKATLAVLARTVRYLVTGRRQELPQGG